MLPESEQHILLIEDDIKLAAMIKQFLGSEGFRVTALEQGEHSTKIIRKYHPDLVILDVMLPGIDGISVCQQIKQVSKTPIIMLTAKGDDMTEIMAMNVGADGYLNKPVRPHVLLAHIKSILRKSPSLSEESSSHLIQVQDLQINKNSYQLKKSGDTINLTAGEFELLVLLANNISKPVNREYISNQLNGINYDGQGRAIDIRISQLRKKLDDEVPPYKYIKTVRNQGYVLVK